MMELKCNLLVTYHTKAIRQDKYRRIDLSGYGRNNAFGQRETEPFLLQFSSLARTQRY